MDFQSSDFGTSLKQESLKDAFTFMFKVPNMWIYAVICMLSVFCSGMVDQYIGFSKMPAVVSMLIVLFGSISSFLLTGYCCAMIRDFTTQNGEYRLPKFNFVEIFTYAFKFSVALGIGFVIPILCLSLFSAIVLTTHLLPMPVVVCLAVAFSVLILYCFLAFFWCFANTQQWTTFLQYKKIFALIRCNFKKYNVAFGAFVGVMILLCVFCFLVMAPFMVKATTEAGKEAMMLNNLLPLILVSIVGTYVSIVSVYITAKCLDIKPTVNEQN